MKKIALIVLALLFSLPAFAADTTFGDLVVHDPWSRATPGGAMNGAAFMVIRNLGTAPDRLIGVDSDVASKTELHTAGMVNGVMEMRPIDAIDVPAGGEALLKPHAFHVMLMGLRHPLIENESFPLTLVFEKAGPLTIEVKIGKAGAMMLMP